MSSSKDIHPFGQSAVHCGYKDWRMARPNRTTHPETVSLATVKASLCLSDPELRHHARWTLRGVHLDNPLHLKGVLRWNSHHVQKRADPARRHWCRLHVGQKPEQDRVQINALHMCGLDGNSSSSSRTNLPIHLAPILLAQSCLPKL